MNARLIFKQIVIYVLIPFAVISLAMLFFGREPVLKFMKYATPVLILPLILKILLKIKDRKGTDDTP